MPHKGFQESAIGKIRRGSVVQFQWRYGEKSKLELKIGKVDSGIDNSNTHSKGRLFVWSGAQPNYKRYEIRESNLLKRIKY